jgi:hypothetical protein
MSHKGKLYPVGFRRDLNLNLDTNQTGWANRYIVTLAQLPPGPGHALEGSTWDCGPEQVTPAETIFWVSDPDIFGPFAFDIILSAPIDGGVSFRRRCEIREAFTGTILRLELINDPQPHLPGFPVFSTWKTLFRDPTFFIADGFSNEVNAIPKVWALGPPH